MPTPENSRNILVVEDEWLVAMDLGSLIEEQGHRIVGPAPTVAAAFSLIDGNPIDAAFLDITLGPEKSFPIADKLAGQGVPLTFLSAHAKKEIPSEFRKYDLLSKPLSLPLFQKQLRKMLGEG